MDPKAEARALILEADGALTALWMAGDGTSAWVFTAAKHKARNDYVALSNTWLVRAADAFAAMYEDDPDPIIDQLGQRLDVIVARRRALSEIGYGKYDPLWEGIKAGLKHLVENPPLLPKPPDLNLVLIVLGFVLLAYLFK